MIAKIAVEAASFAIDKPYSYRIPEGMTLFPGHRVRVSFGRGSRITEGVVLSVEDGDETGLKPVEAPLEETPLLTVQQLRLAAFLRERYFCTFYAPGGSVVPGPQHLRAHRRPRLERKEAAQRRSRSGAQMFGISGRHGGYPGAAPGDSR